MQRGSCCLLSLIVRRLFFVFGSPVTKALPTWVKVRLARSRPRSKPTSSHLWAGSSPWRMPVQKTRRKGIQIERFHRSKGRFARHVRYQWKNSFLSLDMSVKPTFSVPVSIIVIF